MKIKMVLMAGLISLSTASSAELFDRGGGMIYDDVLDITWLQNANQGDLMDWNDSVAWADGLSFGGFDDWRLVSMDVNNDDVIVDCAVALEVTCRDNELGYMFYQNLMGSLADNLTGTQGFFTNIPPVHWSGTEWAPDPGLAYLFGFVHGRSNIRAKNIIVGAWAVRDGDVVEADVDGDGIADAADNCTLISNLDQRDTNGDGYGNACDPDLDNNGIVNFGDVALWGPFFNTATTGDADFDGDGLANFSDYSIYPNYFLQPPGPSGVAP